VKLFRVGDSRIDEVVAALSDRDKNVQINAQRLIRYLGNPRGMAALKELYRSGGSYAISGSFPIPLDDWDYEEIQKDMLCAGCRLGGALFPNYLYALALDGSARAHDCLAGLQAKGSWIPTIPTDEIRVIEGAHPDRELLAHSFFLTADDKRYATVRLLSYTESGDKGLFEIYVNRGILAEMWFHVVLVRHAGGWTFLSISMVGQS
jgi:hypothetical protein